MQPEDCSPQPTNLIKNPNRAKKWSHLITIHSDSWRKDRHKERISSPFIPISRTSLLSSLPGGTPILRHRLRKSGAPSMRTSSFSSASENEAYFSSNVFLHMALVFFLQKRGFQSANATQSCSRKGSGRNNISVSLCFYTFLQLCIALCNLLLPQIESVFPYLCQ